MRLSVRWLAVATSVALIAGLLAIASSIATRAEAEEPPADLAEHAASTGKPVEDVSQRSETNTVFVNPDGTRTLETSVAPVRARTQSGWAPVDYTLVRNADGSFSPRVSPQPVRLSGGGKQPMVNLRADGTEVSLSWPGTLPAPKIEGSRATYSGVLRGVDLVLDVNGAMISQVLVVADAKAASNPALKKLTFAAGVKGGALRNTAAGGVEVIDVSGRPVLVAPAPAMWDSSAGELDGMALLDNGLRNPPTVDRREGPVEGDRVTPVAATASSSALTLEPSSVALTGAGVKYPVYIDPTFSSPLAEWAMVSSGNSTMTTYKWTASGGEGVGHQDSYYTPTTKRLFWEFDTTKIAGARIHSATFAAEAVYSWNCTETGVEVWRTGGISSSTTWTNQPGWYERQSTQQVAAGREPCEPGGKTYTWSVTPAAQIGADAHASRMALGMRASSETSETYWKRFAYTASLSVTYNHPPTTLTNLRVKSGGSTTACTSTLGTATNPIVLGAMDAATQKPQMISTATDPNGDQVKAKYSSAYEDTWLGFDYSAYYASGADLLNSDPLDVPVDAQGRVAAGLYHFNGFAYDKPTDNQPSAGSPRSPDCYFRVEPDSPSPAVIEDAAGTNPDGRIVKRGASLQLTVKANANDTDIVGFATRWDDPQAPSAADPGGTVPVTLPAKTFDVARTYTLYAWAFDAAGNRSETPGTVTIEATDPQLLNNVTWWLDEGAGGSAVGVPAGQPGLAVDSALWDPVGRGVRCVGTADNEFLLTDTNAGADARSSVVFSGGGSFTVSAWLDPSVLPTDSATAWAIEGAGGTVVRLRLLPSGNYEVSGRMGSTWYPLAVTSVVETTAVGLRHVVVSYDAVTDMARLWVAGEEGPWPGFVSEPAEAQGIALTGATTLRLGRDLQGTSWRGAIDAVKVLNSPVSSVENLRASTSWQDALWEYSRYPQDASWGAC